MSLFIDGYARLIYSLFTFLLRSIYKPEMPSKFSVGKHTKMVKLTGIGEKVFNLMVRVIDKKTQYDYTLAVDFEGCKLLIRPFILSEIIMVSGLWEPYVKGILDKKVEDDDTIVDVGANIGIYAIPLAKRVNKVIAFEPDPKTSEILEKSIKLNLLDNIMLIKKPVGDVKKKVPYRLAVTPGYSGIIDYNVNFNPSIESIIEIESIDLATALAMENRVDWLIVDVEGSEVNVLNGARKILQKYSPKIIIEVLPDNVKKVNQILTNQGYSITHLYAIEYYAVKK